MGLGITYRRYLSSAAWRSVRLREFEAAGFACRICGATGPDARLEGHHRSYERFGAEADGDVTALCHLCHHEVTNFLRARRYAASSDAFIFVNTRRLTPATPLQDPTRKEIFE